MANALKAYPNPVKNILNLSSDAKMTSVSVYNLLGQEVLTKTINAQGGVLDMSKLESGVYMVKTISGNEVKTLKVIKE